MLGRSYELKINYIPTLGLQGHKQIACHKDAEDAAVPSTPSETSIDLEPDRTAHWVTHSLHRGSCLIKVSFRIHFVCS